MSTLKSEDAVAIVGYSYRMPGGIHTDDDFWRLLSEREIVQEPITDRYGKGLPTGRRILRPGSVRQSLRRVDPGG